MKSRRTAAVILLLLLIKEITAVKIFPTRKIIKIFRFISFTVRDSNAHNKTEKCRPWWEIRQFRHLLTFICSQRRS